MIRVVIDGFCPACGRRSLAVRGQSIRGPVSTVGCEHPDCPDPEAAAKILSDSEIHHIVRFSDSGTFNAQHPLRERIGGSLLDCAIHAEVYRYLDGRPRKDFPGTTWRVGHDGREWTWERL